jgi:hypothetical protein
MDLKTYIKLFSLREFSSITNRGKKFISLVLVATVSLWAIGFSSGASLLLKEKMDSPFVKFLAVDIPSAKADNNVFKSSIEQELADSSVRNDYDIVDYSFTSFAFNSFYTVDRIDNIGNSRPTKTAKIRPVDPQGELYSFIKREGLFLGDTYLDLGQYPFSIVVTQDFLSRLGYEETPAFVKFRYLKGGNEELEVPIGLAGVVKQLPDKCDIMCAQAFFPDLSSNTYENILDIQSEFHRDRFFIFTDSVLPSLDIETRLDTYFRPTYKNGRIYEILSSLDPIDVEQMLLDKKINFKRVYNYSSIPLQRTDGVIPPDRLTIETSSLTKVNELQLFLDKTFQLKLDMDVIESRKNFLTFNSLSKIMSNVLVLISIGFIIILVIRTLLEHINRNAKNLGTLKAFGMSNRVIGLTYVTISFAIILIVYIITSILLGILANALTNSFLNLVQLPLEGVNLFDFSVLYTYAPFFTILPLSVVALAIWGKIRNETPGDLIYER